MTVIERTELEPPVANIVVNQHLPLTARRGLAGAPIALTKNGAYYLQIENETVWCPATFPLAACKPLTAGDRP